MSQRILTLLPCPTLGSLFDFVDLHLAQSSQLQQSDDVQQLPRDTTQRRKTRALLKQVFQKCFSFLKQWRFLMTDDIKRLLAAATELSAFTGAPFHPRFMLRRSRPVSTAPLCCLPIR